MTITRQSAQKHPYLYLPDGWDTGWKAAKAASGVTPCWITGIGDSVTYGTGATAPVTGGWFGQVRAALISRYGTQYADYFQVMIDTTGAPTANFAVSANSQVGSTGYGACTSFAGAATGTLTFTTPYACTAFDIIYHDRIAGTWDWNLDSGASSGTVTQTANAAIKRKSFTGLSNTVHSVVCSNQSATNVLNIAGAASYKGAPGIGYANCGIGSLQSTGWCITSQARNWQGWQSSGSPTGFGFPSQPALATIAMGLNDVNFAAIGPDQFAWCYQRVVESLRRGYPGCSVLFLGYSCPSTIFSDNASAGENNAEDWPLYLAAMERVARIQRCGFVNIAAKWGETAVARGYLVNASVHPTDAGHTDIATLLAGVL